jgi:hypothetical protein
VTPRSLLPVRAGDYFAEEQVATWGVDSFWGLPRYPRTAYYRILDTRVDDGPHLHEVVVPMLPPAWNDRNTVVEYAAKLATSATPTAVAVSTLDVCQPTMSTFSTDYYSHWGLTHFLLDGTTRCTPPRRPDARSGCCRCSPWTAASPQQTRCPPYSCCARNPP